MIRRKIRMIRKVRMTRRRIVNYHPDGSQTPNCLINKTTIVGNATT